MFPANACIFPCAASLWFGKWPKIHLSAFLRLPWVTSTVTIATQFDHAHGENRFDSKTRVFQQNKHELLQKVRGKQCKGEHFARSNGAFMSGLKSSPMIGHSVRAMASMIGLLSQMGPHQFPSDGSITQNKQMVRKVSRLGKSNSLSWKGGTCHIS